MATMRVNQNDQKPRPVGGKKPPSEIRFYLSRLAIWGLSALRQYQIHRQIPRSRPFAGVPRKRQRVAAIPAPVATRTGIGNTTDIIASRGLGKSEFCSFQPFHDLVSGHDLMGEELKVCQRCLIRRIPRCCRNVGQDNEVKAIFDDVSAV